MSNYYFKESGNLRVGDWVRVNLYGFSSIHQAVIEDKKMSVTDKNKTLYTLCIPEFKTKLEVSHDELIKAIKKYISTKHDKNKRIYGSKAYSNLGRSIELNYDDIFLVDAVVLQQKSFEIDLFFPYLDKRLSVSYEKFREMQEEAERMKQEEPKERNITCKSTPRKFFEEDFTPENAKKAIKNSIQELHEIVEKENLSFNLNDLEVDIYSNYDRSYRCVCIECTISNAYRKEG